MAWLAGWLGAWVAAGLGLGGGSAAVAALGGRVAEMLGSGMNLVTTVIGFGMSATFIVFVCGRAARADPDAAHAVAAARALAQPPAPFDFDVEFHNVADLDRTVSTHPLNYCACLCLRGAP